MLKMCTWKHGKCSVLFITLPMFVCFYMCMYIYIFIYYICNNLVFTFNNTHGYTNVASCVFSYLSPPILISSPPLSMFLTFPTVCWRSSRCL
jgi:hypothetical protein